METQCDGKKPCSRCRNDDAICVFGGRKKKTDRVHPKGYVANGLHSYLSNHAQSYVEILERQQRQLVKGIRAIYDRQLNGQNWEYVNSQSRLPPKQHHSGL